jgi:hypothetical protein
VAVAKEAATKKIDVYKKRYEGLADIRYEGEKLSLAKDLLDDAIDNRKTVVQVLNNIQSKNEFRVLMCSSVGSMTKYIADYCGRNGIKIDTLILFGHGGADSMNVGLGRTSLLTQSQIKGIKEEEKQKEATRLRQLSGVEPREEGVKLKAARVREIDLDSRDRWKLAFSGLKDHVAVRKDTEHFHVFLMACDIASKGKKEQNKKGLVRVVAKELGEVLAQDFVIAAAPTSGVTEGELLELINNLPKVCKALAEQNEVKLGEVPLASSEEY